MFAGTIALDDIRNSPREEVIPQVHDEGVVCEVCLSRLDGMG